MSILTAPPPVAVRVDSPSPTVHPTTPRLAEGIELLGQYQGSGYSEPPYLVRRPDGQVIQMSRLLYLLVSGVDGQRDLTELAEMLTAALGRAVSADNIDYLLRHKLLPLGVVLPDGQPLAAPPPTANPMFALRARGTLLNDRMVNGVAVALRPLFRAPVVLAVLVGLFAVDYWLFAIHGLGEGVRQIVRDPVMLLVVLALTLLSAGFHECGHAAGCRFGGARPGVIGVGIYLVWPSFFTNVTDSYRLSRAGRLRTDLGGLYFNAIFAVGLAGLYADTGAEVLLLVIAVSHLEMLEQLLPFVRFDGYFILSDLIGVPDLFARVAPILRSATRKGRRDPRVTGLRRSARVLVTAWVVCVVPLLTVNLGYLLLHLPEINRTLWRTSWLRAQDMASSVVHHRYALAGVDLVNVVLLALSIAGSLYIFAGLTRRVSTLSWRWSAGRTGRRVLTAAAGLAGTSALLALWTVQGQFSGW